MKHRLGVCFACLAMCVVAVAGALSAASPEETAGLASASTAPALSPASVASSIPLEIKSATAITPDVRDVIHGFVWGQASLLVDNDNTDNQRSARNLLIVECAGVGETCSAAYLDEYATQFAAAMESHLDDPSVRVRINIAVTLIKVADATKSDRLAAMTIHLMKDPSSSVCLCAMKAAGKLMSSALAVAGGNAPLLKAVIPAVEAHNYGGLIVEAAYDALRNPDPFAVGELLDLYSRRVARYRKGIPEEPVTDHLPSYYLVIKGVWTGLSPDRQQQAMQLMCDLLNMSAQYIGTGQVDKGSDTGTEMITLVRETADAIAVVAQNISDPNLAAAVKRSMEMTSQMPNEDFLKAVGPVYSAIHADFPGVKSPPTITGATAPPAEASP